MNECIISVKIAGELLWLKLDARNSSFLLNRKR